MSRVLCYLAESSMSRAVVVSFWSPYGGQEMGRMEVITRTERRRTYSDAEKVAAVAEASAPAVTVREVSQRLGVAESLIYN